jgi:hypothetical protein
VPDTGLVLDDALLAGVEDSLEAQLESAMVPTMAMAAMLPSRLMFTGFPSGR